MSAEYFARFNCDEGLGSPASSVVSDPIYQIRSRSWVSCESTTGWLAIQIARLAISAIRYLGNILQHPALGSAEYDSY